MAPDARIAVIVVKSTFPYFVRPSLDRKLDRIR
jgi:hypothetical protein